MKIFKWSVIVCASLFAANALAQSYSIYWYKLAGGGGTSTGATYQVSGTMGQPEASLAITGGQYSVTGGFWSLLAVVQTAGLPTLTIKRTGGTITVFWPDTVSCTLQQNANLASVNGWTSSGFTVNTLNGTNRITVTPPVGNLFFRLAR